jgi:hypothetical protein
MELVSKVLSDAHVEPVCRASHVKHGTDGLRLDDPGYF